MEIVNFRKNHARAKHHEYMAQRKPAIERIFGDGWYLRPNFVQSYKSKNFYMADVMVKNSPMWNLNPVLCENVLIERVK